MNTDIQKLYSKFKDFGDPLQQRRQTIQKIKQLNKTRLTETRYQIEQTQRDDYLPKAKRNQLGQILRDQNINLEIRGRAILHAQKVQPIDKNPNISDMDKMVFEKKFKNYLNHRQEFRQLAKKRRQKIIKQRKDKTKLQPGQEYYNEEQVLSNTDSDYQYVDANDMLAAYQEIATGRKKKKGGVKLFHSQKKQFALRLSEFENLLLIQQSQSLISKDLLLNYLFEEPCIMMLYSINPYTLADEIADLDTNVLEMLNFEEFSCFLLIDREPTYFQYSPENLQEARKIGRGLKCAPIVGKWIGDQSLLQWMLDIFKGVDLFGDLEVQRQVLAKKLTKQAQQKRYLDQQVIQIVNIGKKLPLRRLIYQIQHELAERQHWPLEQFQNYLQHYHRLETPPKDKLITKLIMAGKFDPTYIFVVSAEVLDILKDIFSQTQKFAQYYVLKEKFIEKLIYDPRYKRIKDLFVRSQGNRYVQKETVQQTLIRMNSQADQYIDIEQILDFFTNRGRPNIIQYQVYLTNLQRQLQIIQQQQRIKQEKRSQGQVSSSDEQYSKQIRQRRIKRKKEKLASIQKSNNFKTGKKFNLTIPVGYNFQNRKKTVSIRQRKVKEMLQDKLRKEDQSMTQFKAKPVPMHVKQNLYERFMKDQQRQRQQRLQRFKLEIANSMVPMPQHLTAPKHFTQHCDFSREQYKFVARPMPWYCQVNLLDRINRKKQERRQQILQGIINRNNDFDLPFGVQQMLQRHDQLQEKRKAQKGTAATISDQLTFMPKITQRVPDFQTLHEHLKIDLEIAKQNKPPIHPAPFSFENRPKKSRTAYQHQPKKSQYRSPSKQRPADQGNHQIPITLKYEALVKLRRSQAQQKLRKKQQQQRANQIRKLRKQKFAPYVRAVLRKKDQDLGRSRQQIQQKIRQYRRKQRNRKDDYQKQMINIYTKVFNRPLLVQSTGQFGQNQISKLSRFNQQEEIPDRGLKSRDRQRSHHNQQQLQQQQQNPQPHQKEYDQQYQRKRKQMIERQPGQYPLQQQVEDDQRYDQNDFEEEFMSDHGHYTN